MLLKFLTTLFVKRTLKQKTLSLLKLYKKIVRVSPGEKT